MSLEQGEKHEINLFKGQTIEIKTSWDIAKGEENIDLDTSIVLINELGNIIDGVFFNKTRSDCGAIKHSGDNQDGKVDGVDEQITIDLRNLNFHTSYLAILINSQDEKGFQKVETATVEIWQGNELLQELYLGEGRSKNGACMAVLQRTNPTWIYMNTTTFGTGKNINESEDLVKESLTQIGFDHEKVQGSKDWTPGAGKQFSVQKDKPICIPMKMMKFTIGLGWNVSPDANLDLDVSILMVDKDGQERETIYYNKLRSSDGAVVHHGDNQSGKGKGDDENITIDLKKLDSEIESIWPAITIYNSGKQFDDVEGAYCRIFCPDTQKQFLKYNLSQNKDGVSNGNIVASISRLDNGQFSFNPRGYYTQKTQDPKSIVKVVRQVIKNDLTNCLILPDDGLNNANFENNDCCCNIF